jgi:predicted Ser/Thr protein kinase
MENENEIPMLYGKIKDLFHLRKKIGKGGFGVIYMAQNIRNKENLAIKFEEATEANESSNLLKEAKILHLLNKKGFPGSIS